MTAGDFPILGAPSIGLGTFRNVLTNAGSPAAPEAIGMYNAAISQGVDPAVLLAVFGHESSYGSAGIAVGTRNGFGLRFYGNDSYGGVAGGPGNGWYTFPTWTAGAQHVSELLASGMYGGSTSYNTVRTFPARYAPSSDGNNPASYGASLAANISAWSGSSGVPLAAPAVAAAPVTSAAAPAAAPTAAPAASAAPSAPTVVPGGSVVSGRSYGIALLVFLVLALTIIVGSL